MKRKSLNESFRNYFYGRVPSSHYINCENLLLQIENYKDNKTNKYNIEPNNEDLRDFIEIFYEMKNSVESRFEKMDSYLNFLEVEGQSYNEPLIQKIIRRNMKMELEILCPKFYKFINIVNKRLGISMEYMAPQIKQEKKTTEENINVEQ